MIISQQEEIIIRNDQAETYEDWYLKKGVLFDWVERKSILNALNIQKDDIVLDAGCGTGRLSIEIAKKCKKIYALDFSQKSIDILNKKINDQKIKNIETFVWDITKPLPLNEKIDKVLSIQVIQHIPTESKRLETLKIFYDQLKIRGECLFSVYNFNFQSGEKIMKEGEFSSGFYYLRFTPEEVDNLFKKSGFKNTSVAGCINFKGYGRLSKYNIYRLFYFVAALDVFLSKFRFSCFLGNFLMVKGQKV